MRFQVWNTDNTTLDQIHTHYLMTQASQDRFDDQSVTLRLTKETNAELQVRWSVGACKSVDPDADIGTCR